LLATGTERRDEESHRLEGIEVAGGPRDVGPVVIISVVFAPVAVIVPAEGEVGGDSEDSESQYE
jgi:hypothetical protein